jgi:hypothetical protein
MVVRDEIDLIENNIRYHLEIGFNSIVILDHCSTDGTRDLLFTLKRRFSQIDVLTEDNPIFDHERYANRALTFSIEHHHPEWIFSIDADEFLGIEQDVPTFLEGMIQRRIEYGTIKWLNAARVIDEEHPTDGLLMTSFYEPWIERAWQHEGHFRKSFCRVHPNMQVVAGGHYFRRENNPAFFAGKKHDPVNLPLSEARIYHFEARHTSAQLLRKWKNLSENLVEPQFPQNAPWREKIQRMQSYATALDGGGVSLATLGLAGVCTFWGNVVPPWRLREDRTLSQWLERKM